MSGNDTAVSSDVVEAIIARFTALDQSGDRRAMQKMAQRLGKEQPDLLRLAASYREQHGDEVGEAAVFYTTLVWAIFDRSVARRDRAVARSDYPAARRLPRITDANLQAARELIEAELAQVEGLAERPVHERIAPGVAVRQPDIIARIQALVAEDIREDAMTAECAAAILPPAQIAVEAFDAALSGRRPGEHQGPIQREARKVGRNEPCPCGSGKKFKKCCGQAA